MLSNLDGNNLAASTARAGHYCDPDMLIVGDAGVSFDEAQAQIAAWAVVAAPMLIAFDVTAPTIDSALIAELTNAEIIAISQDPAQVMGVRVSPPATAGSECWARPLKPSASGGSAVAALFLNRGPLGSSPANITCSWEELGLPTGASAQVRDVLTHTDLGSASNAVTLSVAPHAAKLLRLQL
jgi:alpha-galactosidase